MTSTERNTRRINMLYAAIAPEAKLPETGITAADIIAANPEVKLTRAKRFTHDVLLAKFPDGKAGFVMWMGGAHVIAPGKPTREAITVCLNNLKAMQIGKEFKSPGDDYYAKILRRQGFKVAKSATGEPMIVGKAAVGNFPPIPTIPPAHMPEPPPPIPADRPRKLDADTSDGFLVYSSHEGELFVPAATMDVINGHLCLYGMNGGMMATFPPAHWFVAKRVKELKHGPA